MGIISKLTFIQINMTRQDNCNCLLKDRTMFNYIPLVSPVMSQLDVLYQLVSGTSTTTLTASAPTSVTSQTLLRNSGRTNSLTRQGRAPLHLVDLMIFNFECSLFVHWFLTLSFDQKIGMEMLGVGCGVDIISWDWWRVMEYRWCSNKEWETAIFIIKSKECHYELWVDITLCKTNTW